MTLLARPFPQPGPGLIRAYRDLEMAEHGDDEQRAKLGHLDRLPRPWIPETLSRSLRRELWAWLEEVAYWINGQYTWDSTRAIPTCWDLHPHLVLELATVADLRYRAGRSLTGDALEDWHRYCLPAFLDRAAARMHSSCEGRHATWPGKPRQARFDSERADRARRSDADVRSWSQESGPAPTQWKTLLEDEDPTAEVLPPGVDPLTGEVLDDRW